MKYSKTIIIDIGEPFEEDFIRKGKLISKKTIEIKILENGEVKPQSYAYKEPSDIYKEIRDTGEVNLNYCYVKDFSLKDSYLKFNNIIIDGYVQLSKFSAIHAFFDCSDYKTQIIDFSETVFPEGDIEFSQSIFANGRVNFSLSIFKNCELLLLQTKFIKAKVSFDCNDFKNSELNLFDSEINLKITFVLSKFNKYCNFQFKNCNYLDLRGSINRDVINLTNNSKNKHFNIETIDLRNFINLGIIQIDWVRNNVKQLIENQGNETSHREKAEQFRILKENFHKIGQYDDEDKAYVEYRKHEMIALLKERTKGKFLNVFWAYPFYGIAWFVKDWLGSFGTNPWRVLANMGIFYFLFSAIYFFLPKFYNCGIYTTNKNVDLLTDFGRALYHSAITFLTIGYGDYYPSGIIRIFSGIEGFIGLFLMAYFVVAFSRKVLR